MATAIADYNQQDFHIKTIQIVNKCTLKLCVAIIPPNLGTYR